MESTMRDLIITSAANKAKFDARVDKIVANFLSKCKSKAKRGINSCRAVYLVFRDVEEIASAVSSKVVDEFKSVDYATGCFTMMIEVKWPESLPEEKKEV